MTSTRPAAIAARSKIRKSYGRRKSLTRPAAIAARSKIREYYDTRRKSPKKTRGVRKKIYQKRRKQKQREEDEDDEEEEDKLKEFTLFHNLPPELQLCIWKLRMPGPRVVIVNKVLVTTQRGVVYKLVSPTPAPSILHVCQISRHVALKIYQPFFPSHIHSAPIYLDISRDTILFGSKAALSSLFTLTINGMRDKKV
jgi:hypothetical protein